MPVPSNKDRFITSIAKPVANPARYRRHFRIAGAAIVVAAAVYLFFGSLPLLGLIIAGGFATRYVLKHKGGRSRALPR
jgi:hypothetical protein